jgi:hypothetical protein
LACAFAVGTPLLASELSPVLPQSEHLVLRSLDHAQDMTGDRRVFLSVSTPRDAYFVGEPIPVRLRIGVEPEFLRTGMLQLFAHPLDVPVQLQAPWLGDLAGAITVAGGGEAKSGVGHATFALGESIAQGTRAADDLTGAGRYTVLEIDRTYIPESTGELAIPEALLYFAYATRFEDDFLNGRVAKDRVDAFVRSKALALKIWPLPEAGRPVEFSGAVGRFSIDASATPRAVEAGRELKLTLEIEGTGNLQAFDAPLLRELDGFTVYGKTETLRSGRRVITYDIAPLRADVREIPPLAFTYFDTTPPAGYHTLKTKPIQIDVRPTAGAAHVPAATPRSEEAPQHGASTLLWVALCVPVIAVVVLVVRMGLRSRRRSSPPVARDDRDPAR